MSVARIQSAAVALPGKPASRSHLPGQIAGGLVRAMLISSTLMAALVFAGASGPALLGFKTMVVTSGSMEPTIHTGDSVVLRPTPAESIASSFRDGFVRIGDVITFTPFGASGMVTHRVIDVKELQGETYYQTKGDANKTPDANLANAGAVYGKVAFTLPKFGYLVHFAATPLGKAVLIILPMIVLMAKEVRNMVGARKPGSPRATRRKKVLEARLHDVPAT